MTLRARLALAAALTSAVVLVIAGIVVIRLTERDQRHQLDTDLQQQAQTIGAPISRLAQSRLAQLLESDGAPGIDGDRTIRVLDPSNGTVTLSVGASLPGTLGLLPTGLSTERIAGTTYRVETLDLTPRLGAQRRLLGAQPTPSQVQVLAPTASIRAAARSIRRRVLLVGAGALIMIVLLALLITGRELRPLRRLAEFAGRVSGDDDLAVRAPTDGPPEIRTVSLAVNEMLDRIQTSAATRQQALDAARSFAADAAHELRTPLTSMAANLELLADGAPADPAMVGALTADHARISGTLDALHSLTVGDLSTAGREPVDVADLVELAVHESSRHPRLELSADVPSEPVLVAGDRESLRMVLDNLLTNAERHARPDGRTVVRIAVAPDGESWRISVDDDGVGFPAEDADQLLDRFARGPTSAAGSGLGLAIVAQQVRRHGGTIGLRQSPLGGAGVDLRLPRYTD